MKYSLLITGLIAAVGIAVASAQTGSSGKSNKVVLENCLISAPEQALVPAKEAGVFTGYEENIAQEGFQVEKDVVMAHLDNADLLAKKEAAELAIQVAESKANSDAELEVARLTKAVAEKELEGAKIANKKSPGTVPLNELRRMELTVDRAHHEIRLRETERENAAREAKVKKAELGAVEVELERREVIAPLTGVIVERLKHEGEWVQPGETIVKIVNMKRLRVEGFVLASQHARQQMTGAPVVVSVELPGGQVETAEGTIQFVSPVTEASGEYRVWTEIVNREDGKHWVFSPGTVAKMEVKPVVGTAARTAPTKFKLGNK
jgi:multidrug efflux pump subunit AcrA (membrane-fusion protein)